MTSIPPMLCPTPASSLDPVTLATYPAATGRSSRRYVSKSKSPHVGVCCLGAPVFASTHSAGFRHGRLNPTPRHSAIHVSCPRSARYRASEYPGATSNVYALDAHPGTINTGVWGASCRTSSESSARDTSPPRR